MSIGDVKILIGVLLALVSIPIINRLGLLWTLLVWLIFGIGIWFVREIRDKR